MSDLNAPVGDTRPTRLPVTLAPITRSNWQYVIALRVADAQSANLASNLYSLAEAYVEPTCQPRAIVAGATVIGFVMYEYLSWCDAYNIPRYMIDYRWQGHGYGRAGLVALIDALGEDHPGAALSISLLPDNEGARALYASLGFEDTGELHHGEIVMRRPGAPDADTPG